MSSAGNWQNFPNHVFDEVIMTMMGGDILQNVHKCRQVCQSWNVMMSQMTKYEKGNIRIQAESLAAQIMDNLPDPEITTAASLAHHRLLSSVQSMRLSDVDLSSVPAEHLASLASCVTWTVDIYNVSNCDLVSILYSVKCEWLFISSQSLSSEETRALVRAMESGVEVVRMGDWGEMSLDIRALTQYSGQGKCGHVSCHYETANKYREEVRAWARRFNWTVLVDMDDELIISSRW